jgi:hypothetical protein
MSNAPKIGEAVAWRQVNGWEKLRRVLHRFPNLIPHTLAIEVDIARSADVFTEIAASASELVPPECELYVIATSVGNCGVGADNGALGGFDLADDPEEWNAKVQVQYEQGGFRWSNAPVRAGHIFGSGSRPYFWPVPWVIPGGTSVRINVTSRHAGALGGSSYNPGKFRFCFHGFKRFNTDAPLPTDMLFSPRALDVVRRARYQNGAAVRVEPYVYALNFDELGNLPDTFSPRSAHGLEQKTFTVSDALFAVLDQMGLVEDVEALGTIATIDHRPATTCRVTLDVGRRRLDDRALPIVNVFGSARRPHRLAYPLVIPRGGNLTAFVQFATVSQFAGETKPENAYLTFSGIRIFPGLQR